MTHGFRVAALFGLVVVVGVGCADRPHAYDKERPPVDELDRRDKGLQSKDVRQATDELAMDLLSLPELNTSREQWLMVVTGVENQTQDPRFNYDIFTERLRTELSKHGKGRIALIENKDRLKDLQSRELEQSAGRDAVPGPAGIQPDLALYGKIMELRNRGTSYYLMQMTVTNLHTRQQIWTGDYEVRVAR